MFRLKLLGGALIEGPAGVLSGRIAQRRRIALLACMTAGHGRPVSRDKLMALLWPEAESERARHHLSDSIYLIRKDLGEAAVVSAGFELRLDRSIVSSDVVEFDDALLEGRLEEAAALYAGPFLDGFHIDGAPDFEHWLDAERARLARSYARALEALAQEREAARDFTGAAHWWRRLAAHEPTNGRVALQVMRALDAAGDRAGAIQHARSHAMVLHEQFGIEADAEVIALADRLRTGEIPRSPQVPAPTPAPNPPAAAPIAEPPGAAPRTWLKRRPRSIALLSLTVGFAAIAIAWPFSRPSGQDVILVADATRDTALGDFVAERLRQALAQPPRVTVMGRPAIDAVLQRMGRAAEIRLMPEVAREIALREGLKAFVRLDVLASGDGRYLSAALVAAENGELLASESVIALNATEVVAATDQLAEAVRKRFPVRLAATSRRARLYPVTTDSIRALLKYMEGFLAYRLRGDVVRAIELAEEAIAIDPGFAQAHLHLHLFLGGQGTHDRRAYNALLQAYRLRDRLSLYERNLVEGEYYTKIEVNLDRAVDRYRDHVAEARKFGRNQVVVSFLGLAHVHVLLGDLREAERVLQESRSWFPGPFNQALLVRVLYSLGRSADARIVMHEATRQFPASSWTRSVHAHWAAVAGDYVQAHTLALRTDAPPDLPFRLRTAALFDALQGRFGEANAHLQELAAELRAAQLIGAAFGAAAAGAQLQLVAGDTTGAVKDLEAFAAGVPLDSLGAWGQAALLLARFFAQANQPGRAREYLDAYQRALPPELAGANPWLLRQARAALALANRDPNAALTELRAPHPYLARHEWFEDPLIPLHSRPELARAFEQAAQPDSAIAVYERYLHTRALFRAEIDAFELAGAYQRLAVLYEARNDFARAADYQRKLARLWRAGDAPLRRRADAALGRAAVLWRIASTP